MTQTDARVRQAPYLLFILFLSVLALVALLLERVMALSPEQVRVFAAFDLAVCVIFLFDFLLNLWMAPSRWRYFVTWGWLDLLSAVPMVAALRLARSARIVRIVRALRALRVARVLTRSLAERRGAASLASVGVIVLAVLFIASVAILQVEQGPEANIANAEDAVWWSLTTMTTVGYGDRFPVTTEGRLVAGLLMVAGVGLFGALSGFLAAWFVAPGDDRRQGELEALRAEMAEVRRLLESERSGRLANR